MQTPREQLHQALTTGGYTLFLGAGASMEAGLPGWSAALLELADALDARARAHAVAMRDDTAANRYLEAAELLYLADLTVEERAQCLAGVFGKPTAVTKRMRILARAPYRAVVTTNFDRSFLDAAVASSVNLIPYTEGEDDLASARTSRERYFLRIHGRVEVPASLVLARSHYQALAKKPEYANFVEWLVADSTVVFFGFSFADPYFMATLRNFGEVTRGRMRNTGFALLADPPHDSVREVLGKLNILVVPYSPDDGHAEAWDLFTAYAATPPPTPENPSERRLRRILAATLTHLRSSRDPALTSTVFSAAVLAEMRSHQLSLPLDTLVGRIRQELGIPAASERLIHEALAELTRLGQVCRVDGMYSAASETQEDERDAQGTLHALARSILARAQTRYGFTPSRDFDYGPALQEVLLRVFVADGLTLAHSLVGSRTERVAERELLDLVEQAIAALPNADRQRVQPLCSGLLSLLDRPDRHEEELLDSLASATFTLCLTLADPALSDLAQATSRAAAYLDASIVLPWISIGHPTGLLSEAIINHVGQPTVPAFYVNEIVSHRDLARRELAEARLDDPRRFQEYAVYYGLQNINAFLGGYGARLSTGVSQTFAEYLDEVAPFETESEATSFLEKRGLVVVAPPREHAHATYFKDLLRTRLSSIQRTRNDIRVSHDAEMLAVLVSPRDTTSTLVSADRILMSTLAASDYSQHLKRFLLPYQAAALADLRAGGKRAIRGMSRVLFTVRRDQIDQLREFYTNRVLADYEPALTQELTTIVDDIVSEAERQRRLLGSLNALDTESYLYRSRQFTAIDQFEGRFHERMLDARKRHGLA